MGVDSNMALNKDDTMNIVRNNTLSQSCNILPAPKASLRRHFSGLRTLAVGFGICNSWVGLATSFALAVASGGNVTLLYGVILVNCIFVCIGGTLAELASAYPTAGGQYHFSSILAPRKFTREVSYVCGILAAFSWIVIIAAIAVLISQGLLAIVINFVDGYEFFNWHLLLVYLVWSGAAAFYNLLILNKTTWIYDVSFFASLTIFLTILVTCVARSTERPSSSAVWRTFNNKSGWPDGVCFLIGTLTPQFMFAGLDCALHLAEECMDPEKVVPRAIMSTVITGGITAFALAVGLTYSISNLERALSTPTGFPIYEAFRIATGSEAAATIFLVSILMLGTVGLIAAQQTASRMTWVLARDNAVVLSKFLGRTNPGLGMPAYALLFNYVIVAGVGILMVVSSTAFSAVTGTAALLQQLSFGIPAALMIYRRLTSPDFLPQSRPFRIPTVIGYGANIVVVIWTLITSVIYVLPTTLPVTGTTMNYSSAVTGTILIFGLINWFAHAKEHYRGPIDIDEAMRYTVTEGQIVVS